MAGNEEDTRGVMGRPTFLGVPQVHRGRLAGLNAVVLGVPWECATNPLEWAGSELAPSAIRRASGHYGGYLPELGFDVLGGISVGDAGDIPVAGRHPGEIFDGLASVAGDIFDSGAKPVVLGGDRALSFHVVKALAERSNGPVGVIQLGAVAEYEDVSASSGVSSGCPRRQFTALERVRPENMVYWGVRGPRNRQADFQRAEEDCAAIYTMWDMRYAGLEASLQEVLDLARKGTEKVYLTVHADIVDAAFSPGSLPEFDGLTPSELFFALRTITSAGIDGLDFVDLLPEADPSGRSPHLAVWALIHALAGVAMARQRP
ncbi:MAG: arginase family protein [Chloroflexi bacterium]|nr:arginase family protein [Chloroflexota bacterium]